MRYQFPFSITHFCVYLHTRPFHGKSFWVFIFFQSININYRKNTIFLVSNNYFWVIFLLWTRMWDLKNSLDIFSIFDNQTFQLQKHNQLDQENQIFLARAIPCLVGRYSIVFQCLYYSMHLYLYLLFLWSWSPRSDIYIYLFYKLQL